MARPAQHDAAATDIGEIAAGKTGEVEARRDVGCSVEPVLQVHRQRREVGRIALVHHMLHRRVLDPQGLVRRLQALLHRRHQLALVAVERERQAPPRAHDVADELGLLRARRREHHRAGIAVEHARHVDEVDRLVVHLALAELNQALDE